MCEKLSMKEAREIMGENFIGPEELKAIAALPFGIPEELADIPYSADELKAKKEDYILLLSVREFSDGRAVTIRNLREIFGKDPDAGEPCFYNQDWYDQEDFIDKAAEDGWFLIRKKVYEDSRAQQPDILREKYRFPSAVSCVYAFFTAWFALGIRLWETDFVWCSDTDHNGDRIYVGKYRDVDAMNKNGFSIHRHLALRSCYACID
ncbi:MAG: hypothetical protein IK115_03915 [Lachnospiraceae bacterium]|nr:hypothetical protein [Lachnospiraceae bacterium]